MKKVLGLILVMVLLCSCVGLKNYQERLGAGIWISCYELDSMLESKKGFKEEFKTVIKNCKEMQIQNLYIHTRAFGETLYLSDYFPLIKSAEAYDYDVFSHIIKECKKADLKVHAWINPYRISTSTVNIDEISKQSPAYKWLKDENLANDSNVGFAKGIYLNPASSEVRALVLDGIRELIAKYEIDGIHFDDYFYPTTNTDFDAVSFAEYKKSTDNPLNLSNWRRNNVNTLVSACYSAIKYADERIVFSISPTASVEHNFENLYADVAKWVKEGYVDEIIPQLYFGFNYPDESFRFDNLLTAWKNLVSHNSNVKLKIGLGSYKAIPELEADKEEWGSNSNIIARQVEICENDRAVAGYVLFSYSSVFGEKEAYKKQKEKLLEYLKIGEVNE